MFDREHYILTDTPLKNDLLKVFKHNDKLTILDVGGCEGEESIRYSRLFPNARIFIFEPLPSNQILIKQNLTEYQIEHATLIPMAVSNEDGTADFYVSSGHPEYQEKELNWDFGNKSSSLLEPEKSNIHNWLRFNEKITVNTISLDSFLIQNKITEIDFVHMDVQGAELNVLIGAELSLKKIKAMWLEVADVHFYKNQVLRKDIEHFMKDKGFYLLKSEMEGKSGDQFYINKKYFGIYVFFYRLRKYVIYKYILSKLKK